MLVCNYNNISFLASYMENLKARLCYFIRKALETISNKIDYHGNKKKCNATFFRTVSKYFKTE